MANLQAWLTLELPHVLKLHYAVGTLLRAGDGATAPQHLGCVMLALKGNVLRAVSSKRHLEVVDPLAPESHVTAGALRLVVDALPCKMLQLLVHCRHLAELALPWEVLSHVPLLYRGERITHDAGRLTESLLGVMSRWRLQKSVELASCSSSYLMLIQLFGDGNLLNGLRLLRHALLLLW